MSDDEHASLSHYLLPLLKSIMASKRAIVSMGKVRDATRTAARNPTVMERPTQSKLRSMVVSTFKGRQSTMYSRLVVEAHAQPQAPIPKAFNGHLCAQSLHGLLHAQVCSEQLADGNDLL